MTLPANWVLSKLKHSRGFLISLCRAKGKHQNAVHFMRALRCLAWEPGSRACHNCGCPSGWFAQTGAFLFFNNMLPAQIQTAWRD